MRALIMDKIVSSINIKNIQFNPLGGTLDIDYILIDNSETVHFLSIKGINLIKLKLEFDGNQHTISFDYNNFILED